MGRHSSVLLVNDVPDVLLFETIALECSSVDAVWRPATVAMTRGGCQRCEKAPDCRTGCDELNC